MIKKLIIIGSAVVIGIAGFIIYQSIDLGSVDQYASDPQNVSVILNEKYLRFINGVDIQVLENSSSTITTRIFGVPTFGDISGDGKDDAVFFVSQEGPGTGTFYFAAAAKKMDKGWEGTNAIFLGDRIAPQNIGIKNGIAGFNFATRRVNEPFTTMPSVGVTKRFTLIGGALVER